jgi:3-hydroxyisobutyrate dehydrogenase-like beta-hydroxyacid dehydrogenase
MSLDDAAVEGTVSGERGVLQSLPVGRIHVSMSTISVALSERLGRMHQEIYATAPVFGRPEAAAEGKLFIVARRSPRNDRKVPAIVRRDGVRHQ